MENVIVLNADYQYLTSVSWKKAVCLFYKGKVEVLKYTDYVIQNFEKTIQLHLPSIVKLIKFVKIKYNSTQFSKYNVFLRDDFKCQYCGSVIAENALTIDHILPKSKGGKTTWTNVVTCCKKCNLNKGNKTLKECGYVLLSKPYKPFIYELIKKKLIRKGKVDIVKEFFF